LSCLVLPCLALPCLALPCLALPCLGLALPCLVAVLSCRVLCEYLEALLLQLLCISKTTSLFALDAYFHHHPHFFFAWAQPYRL
jgi:hypothetical protein